MIRFAPLAMAMLTAAGATASPGTAAQTEWRRAAPGRPWSFPQDHWAHDGYRTEWWYVVGFASEAGGGRRFAFQFTIFRTGLAGRQDAPPAEGSPWTASHAAMGHAALLDLDAGERVFVQTIHREAPGLARFGAYPDPEIAWMAGPAGTASPWSIGFDDDGESGAFRIRAAEAGSGMLLDLRLRPVRAPILHGDGGYSVKSAEGGASHYYGFTRLEAGGEIGGVGSGETVAVSGSAWMDREFGSSWLAADQVGWDWFGLALADGRDLMLYVLRREDGSTSHASGTLREADGGTTRRLGPGDFAVEATGSWRPADLPDGGAAYPAGWRIRIGDEEPFVVVPVFEEQENRRDPDAPGPDIPYWEGAARVLTGPDGDRPGGRGFVELTGYRTPLIPGLSAGPTH